MQSLFSTLPPATNDAIFALVEAFQKDPSPHKVSLSIGTYFEEDGRLPVMTAVRQASHALAQGDIPHPYLPIPGLGSYRNAARELVLGSVDDPERVATLQTVGGTGALKLAADLLRRSCPQARVWLSDPTWENHEQIFSQAGFAVQYYPYYDAVNGKLRFDSMLQALQGAPTGTIVVLHACCHNPTGVDLDDEQWDALIALCQRQGLVPLFDLAYQGFGQGLEEDAEPIRKALRSGLEFLVASSFSKNFSLYGERCGALNIVCHDAAAAQGVLGQIKQLIRGNYSTPPTFGAALVAQVLCTPSLCRDWEQELGRMRARLTALRHGLHDALLHHTGQSEVWDCVRRQQGLFSYLPLSPEQVETLRQEHAVYLLRSGRLCVAGLTRTNIDYVAQAIVAVSCA